MPCPNPAQKTFPPWPLLLFDLLHACWHLGICTILIFQSFPYFYQGLTRCSRFALSFDKKKPRWSTCCCCDRVCGCWKSCAQRSCHWREVSPAAPSVQPDFQRTIASVATPDDHFGCSTFCLTGSSAGDITYSYTQRSRSPSFPCASKRFLLKELLLPDGCEALLIKQGNTSKPKYLQGLHAELHELVPALWTYTQLKSLIWLF